MATFVEECLFINWRTGMPMSINDIGLVPYVNVAVQFGAKGDGLTSSADGNDTAFQLAATYISDNGGGTLYVPPGIYYRRNGTLLGSNTKVIIDQGATIICDAAGWVGGGIAANSFFRNINYNVSVLTDHDICIEGGGVLDWDTFAPGDAHSIRFRYVDRVNIKSIRGYGGNNVTALLACRDTFTFNCYGLNCHNCAFDHWDGARTAIVAFCTVRLTSGYAAQGIQFTATATDFSARTANNCKVIGCNVFGIRNAAGTASAIIANDAAVGSNVLEFHTYGNFIEDCDNGLVCDAQTAVSRSVMCNDVLTNVTKGPILLQGSGVTYSRVTNPTLINCAHSVANIALIALGGQQNDVTGVKVVNSSGVAAYDYIGWFNSSNNCTLQINKGQTGLIGRVLDNGTLSAIDDWDAWTSSFVPTVTSGTGAFTSVSASCIFTQVGRTINFSILVSIVTNGTAATDIRVTIPKTMSAFNRFFGGGREALTGTQLQWGDVISPSSIRITDIAGAYPGGDGRTIRVSGSYESIFTT